MWKPVLTRLCCLIVFTIVFLISSSTVVGQTATLTIKCEETTDVPTTSDQKNVKKKIKQDPRALPAKSGLPETSTAQKTPQTSSLTLNTIRIGCDSTATIEVTGGPPNQTITYSMVQTNPANIVGFKWNAGDPTTQSLQVPVQLNGSGYGLSNVFLIRGLLPGLTTTYGQGAGGLLTSSADLTIVECRCPSLVVISPPRN